MDPERPIEKLLQSCARKRREEAGAPFELHPVNRRLLQNEVASQFAPPRPQRSWLSDWLVSSGPKLAWALAMVAVLLCVGVLLVPRTHRDQPVFLAQNEPTPAAPESPAPAGADNLAPPRTDAGKEISRELNKLGEQKDELAPTPAAPRSEPSQPSKNFEVADSAPIAPSATAAHPQPNARPEGAAEPVMRYGLAGGPQPTPPSNAKTKTAVTLAAAAQVTNALAVGGASSQEYAFSRPSQVPEALVSDSLRQRASFSEPYRNTGGGGVSLRTPTIAGTSFGSAPSGRSAGVEPVLVSFKLEQSGREMRITDQDGSIYTGSVQPADSLPAPTSGSREENNTARDQARLFRPEPDPNRKSSPGAVFFTVTGTNRTLKQKVVFTGNLQGSATISAETHFTNSFGAALPGGAASASSARLINSRISGKAVVGDRQVIDVNVVQQNR
jgi:hypothetical protein